MCLNNNYTQKHNTMKTMKFKKKNIHLILCKFKTQYIFLKLSNFGGLNLQPHAHYPNNLTTIPQVLLLINSKENIYKLK